MAISDDELELVRATAEGAVKGLLAPVHEIFLKLVGASVDELSEGWRDQIRFWKKKNAIRQAVKIQQLVAPLGLDIRPVPPRLVLDVLEEGSKEDDEDLQDMWAALIFSAADPAGPSVHPAYTGILRELAGKDAKLLVVIAKEQIQLRKVAPYAPVALIALRPATEHLFAKEAEADFRVSLESLVRQRLVERFDVREDRGDSSSSYAACVVSELGWAFLRAVSPPGSEGWKLFHIEPAHGS